MSVLAWFQLPDEETVEKFKAVLISKKYDALFEGWGIDKRDNTVEGYAVFPSKKKMESCAREMSKNLHCYLIDHVT